MTGAFTPIVTVQDSDGSSANLPISDYIGNPPPTVATAASAAVSTDGTTVALSAVGADHLGESYLTYTWDTLSIPAGAGLPTFSANDDNAAKNSTATLSGAGDYTFEVTITNQSGLSITSDVDVTVAQIPATLSIRVN